MTTARDELAGFLASPPRILPDAVRRARLPATPFVLALVIAALLIGGSVPIAVVVFPDRIADDLRLDLGSPAHATGTVTSVTDSGRELVVREGDRDVTVAIRRVGFRFTPADGPPVDGVCHESRGVPAAGAEVDVEYLFGAPAVARIVGSTASSTPRIGAFVVAIPAIGVAWLLRVLALRRRTRRLLVHGRFALARVEELDEHRVTFGPPRVRASLCEPDGTRLDVDYDGNRREAALLRAAVADDRPIGLLHDPRRPERVMFAETLVPRGRNDGAREALDEDEPDDDPFDDDSDDDSNDAATFAAGSR